MANTKATTSNIMDKINNIWDLILFTIKFSFTSRMFISLVITLSIFAMIIPVVLFPWTSTACFSYFIMVTIPLLICIGSFSFNFRNSSLYVSLKISGFSKWIFYFSQLVSMWIIAMILSLLFLILFNIIASFGILLYNYANFGDEMIQGSINKNIYSIINFFYVANVNVLLTFSIYFLFRNIVKTKTQYYSLIWIIIIVTLIFGGILNGYYDSVLMVDKNGVVLNNYDSFSWYIDKDNSYTWYPTAERGLFPMEMFIPSLIFPYFSIGQMFTFGYALIGNEIESTINSNFTNASGFFSGLPQNAFWNFSFKYNFDWIATFVMPYIWVSVSFAIGVIFSKVTNE